MKRLVNTQLFCLLKKMDGTFNPCAQEIALVYDDFVYAVTLICTSPRRDVLAYFTIHYTRLELEGFQMSLRDKRAGKKCSNSKLHNL